MTGSPNGGSLSSLRQLNRVRVLDVVRAQGPVSRAEISRSTGLARSTVSNLVADLHAGGLVIERLDVRGSVAPHGGRPSALLSLDPSAGAVLAIQFDHLYVHVAVADVSFAILAEVERELDVDHDAAAGLDAAAELVDEALAIAGVDRDHVLGAGIGLAGPIGWSSSVGSSSILPSWVGIDVAAELGERLGLPTHVDNDANLGALAESVLGAGRGAPDMIYLFLSSGIGAGLILDGRLYRGAGGTSGEIGHVLVDERGPMCRCGNRGCLETLVGAGALVQLMRQSHGPQVDVAQLIERARGGDPGFVRALSDAGRIIGGVLGALCNQLNPARVVVGGPLAAVGDVLLDPLRQAVGRNAVPAATETLEIVPGQLGARAELLGALILAVGQSDGALSAPLQAVVGA